MLLKCFVLLCLVVSCFSQEKTRIVGKPCELSHDDGKMHPGSCQPISSCLYAMKLIYVDEVKPPFCFEDGQQPSFPIAPEPLPDETGCPALDNPAPPSTLTTAQLIAWNKCVENLRYVRPCDKHQRVRNDSCGIPTERFRISGGRLAVPGEFPHMAVLGVVKDCANRSSGRDDAEWVGTGALVSDRFVLTAAHVLLDPYLRPLRYALVGAVDKTDNLNGLLYIIVRTIPQDLYDWPHEQYDIALLELDRRVALSSSVRPICLPVPGQVTDWHERDIAGWRHTAESAEESQLLYTAQVTLANNSECQTEFETPNFHYNASAMLCVKGNTPFLASPEPCENYYYTGGPLSALLSNVPCSHRVEGVASACEKGSAGVYTRVEHYLDWIVRNVWTEEWQRATDTYFD